MTKANEPAMPFVADSNTFAQGLTKREYMATKIMAAYVSGSTAGIANGSYLNHEYFAHEAVKATDALIERLNSEEQS